MCLVYNKHCSKLKLSKQFNSCYFYNTMRLALFLSHFTHEDMRQNKVKWLAQGNRVWKWQTWTLKSCSLALEFIPSATILLVLLENSLFFPTKLCQFYLLKQVWTLLCSSPLLPLWNKSTSPLLWVIVIAPLWVSVYRFLPISDMFYTLQPLKKYRYILKA